MFELQSSNSGWKLTESHKSVNHNQFKSLNSNEIQYKYWNWDSTSLVWYCASLGIVSIQKDTQPVKIFVSQNISLYVIHLVR